MATNTSASFFGSFGNNTQQQQQQQPAQPTNLFSAFGSQPQQNATTGTQGSNIFGSSAFGQPQQQQQGQQQPQTTAGTGLFGSTAQPGASLFGAFGASTQQQPPTTSAFGSFGKPAQTASPFGASTSAAPQTAGIFGAQPVQQQINASSAAPLFTRTTKFNDLPDDIKRRFESIDSHIQGRIQISNDLKRQKLGEEPLLATDQIRAVHKDLVNAINGLRSDMAAMRELNAKLDQSVQDTVVATHIIDGFRNPQQHGAYLKNHANFPLEFFARVTDQLRERLRWFNNTIEQIEQKISSEASNVSISPQGITATLQAQHASFMALASKTASLDNELQKLKTIYIQLWRAKTGSARDPFNRQDRGDEAEFGIEGLNVK